MLWALWVQSKTWHTPPHKLLGLPPYNAFLAYCIDDIVFYVGSYIELELDKIGNTTDGKTKSIIAQRERRLKVLLEPKSNKTKGQFMDPAVLM